MVVVKIMQGLGNQMFQYAAGRALALHLNTTLKVNTDNYSATSLRQYELSKFFEINPPIITTEEMQLFPLAHPVRRFWNKFFPSKKIRALPYEEVNILVKILYRTCYIFRKPHLQRVYEEKQFHFDNDFFNAKSPVFLKGYWQSYKYFDRIKESIKKDFIVRKELVSHLSDIKNEMNNVNSIALHIRCTDKLSPTHLKLHGRLTKKYYENGIEYIKRNLIGNNICIYVFTDDVNVAKEYVPEGYNTIWLSGFVTKNAIEDFYLMQHAKGIVASNSTFSWWAAYLNIHEKPLVIVPEKWYVNAQYNDKDIYPKDWVLLNQSN